MLVSRKNQLKNDLAAMKGTGQEGSEKWIRTVEEIEAIKVKEALKENCTY